MALSPEQREELGAVLNDACGVLANGRLSLALALRKMATLEQAVVDSEEMIQPKKNPKETQMKVRLRIVTQKILSQDQSLEFESVPRAGELIDLRGAPLLPEPFSNELYVVTQVSHQWSPREEKLIPCVTLQLRQEQLEEIENRHRVKRDRKEAYLLALQSGLNLRTKPKETAE